MALPHRPEASWQISTRGRAGPRWLHRRSGRCSPPRLDLLAVRKRARVSKAFGPNLGLHSTVAQILPSMIGLQRIAGTVDRRPRSVLARHLAGSLEGRDRADRHLVIVRIDRRRIGMGLQQRSGT